MAKYVDGFVLTVPKNKMAAYKKMAKIAGKAWKKYGALEYRECIADDLKVQMGKSFIQLAKPKAGETVVFSWIVYKSKADRNRINAKVMKDASFANMDMNKMPFDCKRMTYGGFKIMVDPFQK